MHGGKFRACEDLLASTEVRVTRFKKTSSLTHSSKSDLAKTGVFLLITGCTRAANDCCKWLRGESQGPWSPILYQTKEHISGVQQSGWPHLSSNVIHPVYEPHRWDSIPPQYTILTAVQFHFIHMFTVRDLWDKFIASLCGGNAYRCSSLDA